MSRYVRNRALVLTLVLAARAPLFGQTGLGSITGEVLDPTGAHIPRASVRLVEKSTQTVLTTASNTEGIFTFPSVPVGSYTLTMKATGFRDRVLDNLDVTAYQQISLGKLALEI